MKFSLPGNVANWLLSAGYQKWHKGMIRVISKKGHRFHALLLENNEIDLHFDKVVKETKGKYVHKSKYAGLFNGQLKGEIKRIINL